MIVTDLTGKYIENVFKAGNTAVYQACYPNLFNHYFTFWAKREYPEPNLSADDFIKKAELIKQRVDHIGQSFESHGINLDELEFVLFVGRDSSNGHAFFDEEKFIVWLPVETYHTIPLVDIFVTHEILHALHYQKHSEFYFENPDQFQNPMRQLITEGIATCLSGFVLDVDDRQALWADYLSDAQLDGWFSQCETRASELKNYFREAVFQKRDIPEFFRADESDDIKKYRGGYYLGLRLVRSLAKDKKILPLELLDVNRVEFEKYAVDWLRE